MSVYIAAERLRPRWGEEILDRISEVYTAERAKVSAGTMPSWEDLPIEMRLALIAVYSAGRIDGGR